MRLTPQAKKIDKASDSGHHTNFVYFSSSTLSIEQITMHGFFLTHTYTLTTSAGWTKSHPETPLAQATEKFQAVGRDSMALAAAMGCIYYIWKARLLIICGKGVSGPVHA